jgi:hypothetical protein
MEVFDMSRLFLNASLDLDSCPHCGRAHPTITLPNNQPHWIRFKGALGNEHMRITSDSKQTTRDMRTKMQNLPPEKMQNNRSNSQRHLVKSLFVLPSRVKRGIERAKVINPQVIASTSAVGTPAITQTDPP